MKKTLLLSAVTLVTLGISSISYGECRDSGDWVCFKPLEDLTYDKEPDASCMEMICSQGCVENTKDGDGACCPIPKEGTNCLDDEYNDKGCLIKKKITCPSDKPVCQSDGTCGCPEGVGSYTKTDGTTGCCPAETPKWDDTQQKCVESETCVHLFQRNEDHKQGMGEDYGCCPEGSTLTTMNNTLNTPRGYILGGKTTKYGCCPEDRANKVDPNSWICCAKTQKVVSTGCCDTNKIYTEAEEEKCCPANANLPKSGEQCNTVCGCYLDSGLTCNTTTSTCTCPENYGWDSATNKCLPYCTEDMGIFLLVDRSGSTFKKGSKDYYCDGEKDACQKINGFLKGLDLSDRNYALYNEETTGCGYNQAMSMLPFGQHSSSDYELWNDVQYKVKCSNSNTTQFDEALNHIRLKYCKKDNPIIIAIITDGKVQEDKDDMSSSMNAMIKKCDARIVYIGPDGSTLEKYMDKHVTNFRSYDFDDSVQSWIRGTNDAINNSCIPTNKGKKTPSQSDSSWFCNVLNNADDGDSYLRLTEDQCFFCGTKTKFRWSGDRKKWGSAGVCCGKYNNKGSCKDNDYRWWDETGRSWGK